MSQKNPVPGTGGERYIPYEERTGKESVVYLQEIFRQRDFAGFMSGSMEI